MLIAEQHSHIGVPRVQMCYGCVNSDRNGIFSGSVVAVGKLEWVQCAWHAGLAMGHDQPLEALQDHIGEHDGTIVICACHVVIFGHWGLLKASRDYSLGQEQVKDFREDAR